MDWKKRYRVALGVADGLSYLHNDCPRRIIHRDIKASNILLSQDYEAQISDFGLAKWLPENWPHHIVFPIEGTFGSDRDFCETFCSVRSNTKHIVWFILLFLQGI